MATDSEGSKKIDEKACRRVGPEPIARQEPRRRGGLGAVFGRPTALAEAAWRVWVGEHAPRGRAAPSRRGPASVSGRLPRAWSCPTAARVAIPGEETCAEGGA